MAYTNEEKALRKRIGEQLFVVREVHGRTDGSGNVRLQLVKGEGEPLAWLELTPLEIHTIERARRGQLIIVHVRRGYDLESPLATESV